MYICSLISTDRKGKGAKKMADAKWKHLRWSCRISRWYCLQLREWTGRQYQRKGMKRMRYSQIYEAVLTLEMKRAPPFCVQAV